MTVTPINSSNNDGNTHENISNGNSLEGRSCAGGGGRSSCATTATVTTSSTTKFAAATTGCQPLITMRNSCVSFPIGTKSLTGTLNPKP